MAVLMVVPWDLLLGTKKVGHWVEKKGRLSAVYWVELTGLWRVVCWVFLLVPTKELSSEQQVVELKERSSAVK